MALFFAVHLFNTLWFGISRQHCCKAIIKNEKAILCFISTGYGVGYIEIGSVPVFRPKLKSGNCAQSL